MTDGMKDRDEFIGPTSQVSESKQCIQKLDE